MVNLLSTAVCSILWIVRETRAAQPWLKPGTFLMWFDSATPVPPSVFLNPGPGAWSKALRNSKSTITAMLGYLLSCLVSLFLVLLSLSNDEEAILMKSDNDPLWDYTNTPAHPMPSTTLSNAHLTINVNAHAYVSEYTLTQTYVQAHCVQRHNKLHSAARYRTALRGYFLSN